MPKDEIAFFAGLPEPKQKMEHCVYCSTEYDKKERRGDLTENCPNCGGMVTREMGYLKSAIGRTIDYFVNPNFSTEKVTNEEELARLNG